MRLALHLVIFWVARICPAACTHFQKHCSSTCKHTLHIFAAGDFRMIIGENRRKVTNIVKANLTSFQKLYSPYLCDLVEYLPDGRMMKVYKTEMR